jgi:hypothetical protein
MQPSRFAQAIRDNGIGHLTCFEDDACLQGASIAQLAWRGLGSSISWNEQDRAVDFLVVCGHFEPDDEVWALDHAAGALTSARHVVLHGGPTAERLLGLLPPSKWAKLPLPTPRSLVVLSRIDG